MDGLVLARSTPCHWKLSQRRSWRSGATHAFAFSPIFAAFIFFGEHVMNKAHNENAKGMVHVLYLLCSIQYRRCGFWFQYDPASLTEFLSCKLTHFTAHSQLTCIVGQEPAQFVFLPGDLRKSCCPGLLNAFCENSCEE